MGQNISYTRKTIHEENKIRGRGSGQQWQNASSQDNPRDKMPIPGGRGEDNIKLSKELPDFYLQLNFIVQVKQFMWNNNNYREDETLKVSLSGFTSHIFFYFHVETR